MSPFLIPLGVFAMVVILVAIGRIVRVRDKEMEVHQKLHLEEMEHLRKMQELDLEIERIKQGN